jgi:hypothetical protein
MWLAKKDYIDAEYFSYILRAAELKYLKELEKGNNEYFYEVMFNYLNLNNLVLDGNMFDFKMQPSWKNSRIIEISRELSLFYETHNQSGETVRFANSILRSLAINYLQAQHDIFDIEKLNVYYVNSKIQLLHRIYILLNVKNDSRYDIWKLKMDRRRVRGWSFQKVESLQVENIEETPIKERLAELNNPELSGLCPDANLIFCICKDDSVDIDKIADCVKNSILLNKLMGNDNRFDPNLIENSLEIILDEQILPFKLSEQFL